MCMNISKLLVFGLFTISLASCSMVVGQSSGEKYTPQCGTSGYDKMSVEDYVRVGMFVPEFVCVARRYNRNPRFDFPCTKESKGVYFCFAKNGKSYYARSIGYERIDEVKVVDSMRLTYDGLMENFPFSEWKTIRDPEGIFIKHSIAKTDIDGISKLGAPTSTWCNLMKMFMSPRVECSSSIPVYGDDGIAGVLTFDTPSGDEGEICYFDSTWSTQPGLMLEVMEESERSRFWMPPLELDESYSAKECYTDAENPVDTDIERKAYEAVSTGKLTDLSSFGINPYYKDKLYATVGDCSIVGTMTQYKDEKVSGKYRCEVSDVQVTKRAFLRKRDFDLYRDGMKREEMLSLFGYPNANWQEDLDDSSQFGSLSDSVCGNYSQRVFAYPVYSDCVEKPTNEDIVAIAVIHFQEKEGKEYVSSGIEFHDSFYEWNLPRY